MYSKELEALKKANLYRQRELMPEGMIDLASNDYLGLAEDFEVFEKAVKAVRACQVHSPKASQLVNGYHSIHWEFENYLKWRHGFEDAIVVGSGFLANLSLIEALPRKGDIMILDEAYHASGVLASKLLSCDVYFFKHNDEKHLEKILQTESYTRAIVAVEGIYSMSGEVLNREIFTICAQSNVIMIVDEAHSAGVLGDDFLGIFSHYNIKPQANHIMMGTLGKALGSYGAYILASKQIIEFLQNRAKAIVYATAPSVFDTALAHESLLMIEQKKELFREKREIRQKMVREIFGIQMQGLILKISVADVQEVLALKTFAREQGFLIGAIRPPTVKSAILRIILRLNVDEKVIKSFLLTLKERLR